jgi:hypothetical protein
MSSVPKHSRQLLVAVCCVALGAGVSAITSAGAAPNSGHPSGGRSGSGAAKRSLRDGGLRRLAVRAVHGDVVVRTKAGLVTVAIDRGKVDAVSGRQLTITEGTKKASYKTVTLTIPTGASVRDDRQVASLSGLKAGQRVLVLKAPKRTFVIARTPRAG